jgi:hypothetical protein
MKNTIKGFINLSAYVDRCLQETYKTKGLALKKIIYDWPKIVGENLSDYAIPYKVTNGQGRESQKRILHIFVANNSFSSELFYLSGTILEKIALYTGSDYVDQLKFDLKPSLSSSQLSEEDISPILSEDPNIDGIEDPILEDSLRKFGQFVLAHQK